MTNDVIKKEGAIYKTKCAHCGAELVLQAKTKMKAIRALRRKSGAVSEDRKRFYCPNCAPFFRNVGCKGGPKDNIQMNVFKN